MTWYRKYRPRTVAGLHLTKVRTLIQELMSQGRLPQVMLFAGPKGTGKTSTARIIGALLNDPANAAAVTQVFLTKESKTTKPKAVTFVEPTSDSELLEKIYTGNSYLVQELDAASNRGIDDVRALKERVNLPPQDGLMSVYILDEAHMLTTEAFNALLKLLEEPPAHAVFILATTELHKIPATIVSRCTVVPFTKATPQELSQALVQILEAEKKEFESAAVELVAEYADGSFRDAVKTLELVAAGDGKLDVAQVQSLLTGTFRVHLQTLVTSVIAKDATAISQVFEELRQSRLDPDFFLRQLSDHLHLSLLQSLGVKPGTPAVAQAAAHFLLNELQQVSSSNNSGIPFLPLELKLLEIVFRAKGKPPVAKTPASTSSPTSESKPLRSTPEEKIQATLAVPVITKSLEVRETSDLSIYSVPVDSIVSAIPSISTLNSDNLQALPPGDSAILLQQWDAFVDLVRDKNSSVAALLRSAKPLSGEHGKATIAVFYKFHQEQLQQPKFRKMIEECIEPLTGGKVTLEFVLADSVPTPETAAAPDLTTLAEELLV